MEDIILRVKGSLSHFECDDSGERPLFFLCDPNGMDMAVIGRVTMSYSVGRLAPVKHSYFFDKDSKQKLLENPALIFSIKSFAATRADVPDFMGNAVNTDGITLEDTGLFNPCPELDFSEAEPYLDMLGRAVPRLIEKGGRARVILKPGQPADIQSAKLLIPLYESLPIEQRPCAGFLTYFIQGGNFPRTIAPPGVKIIFHNAAEAPSIQEWETARDYICNLNDGYFTPMPAENAILAAPPETAPVSVESTQRTTFIKERLFSALEHYAILGNTEGVWSVLLDLQGVYRDEEGVIAAVSEEYEDRELGFDVLTAVCQTLATHSRLGVYLRKQCFARPVAQQALKAFIGQISDIAERWYYYFLSGDYRTNLNNLVKEKNFAKPLICAFNALERFKAENPDAAAPIAERFQLLRRTPGYIKQYRFLPHKSKIELKKIGLSPARLNIKRTITLASAALIALVIVGVSVKYFTKPKPTTATPASSASTSTNNTPFPAMLTPTVDTTTSTSLWPAANTTTSGGLKSVTATPPPGKTSP